jgi:hypothetical protein
MVTSVWPTLCLNMRKKRALKLVAPLDNRQSRSCIASLPIACVVDNHVMTGAAYRLSTRNWRLARMLHPTTKAAVNISNPSNALIRLLKTSPAVG